MGSAGGPASNQAGATAIGGSRAGAETAVGTQKVDVKQDPTSTHVIKAKTMVGSINVSGATS